MRVFNPSDTIFTSQGEKAVCPITCVEHREISDWYVECKFPLDCLDYIKQDYILIVETKEKNEQPFRINNIEVGNTILCKAYHVGYDTKNYAVELSTVVNGNCNACLVELKTNIEPISTPFVFSSDINLLRSFSVTNVSLYEALGQIASAYAGTLDFDGWNVYILNSIGQDRGISIEYGKNLENAIVKEDWGNVVTKIKPIGNNGIVLTPEWLTADVTYDKPYTKIITFDTDSVENLEFVAQLYLDRFKLPRINYSVKSTLSKNGIAQIFVNKHGQLEAYTHEQLSEFSHAQINSTSNSVYFGIGDTIMVKARQFEVTTDVISYDYNCLTKYVIGIEFGNYRPTVKNFFTELKSTIEENTTKKVQVKIDQITGDFTIAINNYNNGLLQGTYYNFDGDSFTITNADDETVFSADVDGNLTLTGTIIGSLFKSSIDGDRFEFDDDSLRAYTTNVVRAELTNDTLKFESQNGTNKIFMTSDEYRFKISTQEYEFNDRSHLWATNTSISLINYYNDDDLMSGVNASSGVASIYSQKAYGVDSGSSVHCSADGLLNIGSYDNITNENCGITFNKDEVFIYSNTYNYKIVFGGAFYTIYRDSNGFLKC